MPLDLQHGRAAWESRCGCQGNFNLILSHFNPPQALAPKLSQRALRTRSEIRLEPKVTVSPLGCTQTTRDMNFTGQAERMGASVSLLSWQREASSRVAPVPWPPLQRTIRDLQPVEARLDGLRPQVLNSVLVRGGLVAA